MKSQDTGDGGYTFMGRSIVFKKGNAEVSVFTPNYKGALSKSDAAKLIATRVAAAMKMDVGVTRKSGCTNPVRAA